MPIGFQNRRPPSARPTWSGPASATASAPAWLSTIARQTPFSANRTTDHRQPDAVRHPGQCRRRQRQHRQRDQQERLVPADPVGPDPDDELHQGAERRQRRDDPDVAVGQPALLQVQRQIREREPDPRHRTEIGPVESDPITPVHVLHPWRRRFTQRRRVKTKTFHAETQSAQRRREDEDVSRDAEKTKTFHAETQRRQKPSTRREVLT